jgi:hypothetical protein
MKLPKKKKNNPYLALVPTSEQNTHVVLCMNRIPPEQQKPISLGALCISNTAGANT